MITKDKKNKKEPTFNNNRANTKINEMNPHMDAEIGKIETYEQEKISNRNKTYRQKALDTINLEFGEEFNKNKNKQNHNNDNRSYGNSNHGENSNKKLEFAEEFDPQNDSRNKKNDRHSRNATQSKNNNGANLECADEFYCKEEK